MRRCCLVLLLLALPLPGWANGYDQIRYLDNDTFLQQGFAGEAFRGGLLMLDAPLRQRIENILQRPWLGMRLRYWQSASRSAWIIDEVGKDLPITIGVVVGANGIEQVRILVYREPRGGEVHEAFFTRQFERLTLIDNDRLSADIDNITGATLSVDAVSRVAALALALHQQVSSGASP
jgi:hypothetical protein